MSDEKKAPFRIAADLVAGALDADVLFVNAPIYRTLSSNILELCRNRRRRENVVVILVTEGGDANAAYRLARCLQTSYKRCVLYLTGYCKSAGTLVAIGAHELVVADSGELGPLDVQMSKPDELVQRQSGLTATAALSTLHEKAFEAFEHFFLSLIGKSNSAITTRTATHVAVQLTSGLFAPMYEHVDPMHVGEAGRALQIAAQYGEMLQAESGNLEAEALGKLTTGYASHDFVIDFAQIRTLFRRVRQPNAVEQSLADALGAPALAPMRAGERPIVAYLSTEDLEPQEQVRPGLAAREQQHEQTSSTRQQPTPTGDAVEGGADAAGQPGSAASAHVASIGSIRGGGARRRGQTS